MATTHTIKHGDTLPVLDVILYRDEALTQPVDLTNNTDVTLKISNSNGESALNLEKSMNVNVDPTTGRVTYKFALADWSSLSPGDYSMEIEVTWASGDVSTYPKDGYATLSVKADLDPA